MGYNNVKEYIPLKKKHDIMDFGKQSKRRINMGPKKRNK
jgi:hypothetical protein